MAKEYGYDVKLSFCGNMEAESKEEAIEKIKDSFKEEYGFYVLDEEIELLKQTYA